MSIKEEFFNMISQADRNSAVNLLEELAREKGYESVMRELIEPTLKEMGNQWQNEGVSLAQGYVVAKITEDFMKKLAVERADDISGQKQKGPVVIGNIEDDSHSLGRRMVSTFLEADGWEVYDLGNDVPPVEFVEKALEVDAKVIGASAMMYTTAQNIKGLRNEIDRRDLADKIKLAVGGAVFVLRPELVAEVGGDGTARNAIGAPKLFEELWEKASSTEVIYE